MQDILQSITLIWFTPNQRYEMKKKSFSKNSYIFRKTLIFKTLKQVLAEDSLHLLWKFFLKNPLRNIWAFLKILLASEEKFSEDRYFFHNMEENSWIKKLQGKETLLVVGFSYCQKNIRCPSLRFSSECSFDSSQSICRECVIGVLKKDLAPFTEAFIITTSFSFIEKIFEIQKKSPKKELLFLSFACPFAIQLFAPWSSFFRLRGLSFPLFGAICPNFAAFQHAEKGEKKGQTFLQPEQKKIFLNFLSLRKKALEKNRSF